MKMEVKDPVGTFRVTFGEEGGAKLGNLLTKKLKEYMKEDVDDTLVKYVIVLLGNGRHKDEVKEELDVFLGDDSDDFVTWLWDHLESHLDQYVPPVKSSAIEVAKVKPELVEHVDKNDSHQPILDSRDGKVNKSSKSRHNRDWKGLVMDNIQPPILRSSITDQSSAIEVAKVKPELVEQVKPELVEHVDKNDSHQPILDSRDGKVNKSSKSRHNRDWKGLVMDNIQPPILRSSITDHLQNEEKPYRNALRSQKGVRPEPPGHRKRDRDQDQGRLDDRPHLKREVSATRRLLQFAVRDAVATMKPSNSALEPSRKRLRSVVSTSTGITSEEVHPQTRRMHSVAKLPNPMSTAIKAVAEAAKDVRKIRTGNVFDRLSRGADVTDVLGNNQQISKFREPVVEYDESEDYEKVDEQIHQRYLHTRGYVGGYNINSSMIDSNTGVASDSASDNEGYGDVNVNVMDRREMNGIGTGTSRGYKVDDSYILQSAQAQNTDEFMHQTRQKEEQTVPVANAKHKKIVNISVNVNTWKPEHYQPTREMVEVETRKSTIEADGGAGHSNVRAMKENFNTRTGRANGGPASETPKASQKPVTPSAPVSYSTRLEDTDLRTVFVNNVHFAATKDSMSRHFSKFGEVLKVIILTDAATGHPKGSAYIEFMRKEAAENALSLDGTSFMSRIIKVVKKTSGQQEAGPTMTWPRMARGSPFSVPRFSHSPFPRAFPGTYRARPTIKPGARSMQWKRDAQAEGIASPSGNSTNAISPGSRGLTYIRTESSDLNPGGV